MFTSVGEQVTADLWDGTITAPTNWYIGSGTGTTTPAKGDTALVSEVESRATATMSQPSANTNRHVATISYTAAATITEVGVFDASTAGNMVIRDTFAGIGVNNGDKIEFTIDLQTT